MLIASSWRGGCKSSENVRTFKKCSERSLGNEQVGVCSHRPPLSDETQLHESNECEFSIRYDIWPQSGQCLVAQEESEMRCLHPACQLKAGAQPAARRSVTSVETGANS